MLVESARLLRDCAVAILRHYCCDMVTSPVLCYAAVFAPIREVIEGLSKEQLQRWERLWMATISQTKAIHPVIYSHPATDEKVGFDWALQRLNQQLPNEVCFNIFFHLLHSVIFSTRLSCYWVIQRGLVGVFSIEFLCTDRGDCSFSLQCL